MIPRRAFCVRAPASAVPADTLRHVVYQTRVGTAGLEVVRTRVLTLKLEGRGWRAVLAMELRRLGRMFGGQGQVSGS